MEDANMGSSLSSTQIPVRGRSVAAAAGRGCLGEVGPRRGAAGAMRWDHGGGAADGELVRAKGSRPPAKGFRLPVLRHGRLPPRLARRRISASSPAEPPWPPPRAQPWPPPRATTAGFASPFPFAVGEEEILGEDAFAVHDPNGLDLRPHCWR